MSTAKLGMCKLRYLWVSYRILERNFYKSAQSNGVEQYRKPSSQQWILKKAAGKAYISSLHHEWPAIKFTQAFLAGYTSLHEQYHIDIYTQRTTMLFTPTIKSFVALKVLIRTKQENPMVYCAANFTQCVCRGYCESWILSSLLLL